MRLKSLHINFLKASSLKTRKILKLELKEVKKPIDKEKFLSGEDIFFVRIDNVKKEKIEVIAYCQSATNLLESDEMIYPNYFKPKPETIKIFTNGINISLFNEFVYKHKIKDRNDYFTSFISDGKTQGSPSWRWFDTEESYLIMKWFKELIFDKFNIFETWV